MSNIKINRLKEIRELKKISGTELAEKLSISPQYYYDLEKGVRRLNEDIIKRLAEVFQISTDYILGISSFSNDSKPNKLFASGDTISVPILGVVRAGEPIYAEQNILGYFSVDASRLRTGENFYLKVVGDSMNLSQIMDGQLVLIHGQEEVENGQIALVLVNGEDATIKKFYRTGNTVTLMPNSSNTEHQPRVIDLKEVPVKVIGKVVGTYIDFER